MIQLAWRCSSAARCGRCVAIRLGNGNGDGLDGAAACHPMVSAASAHRGVSTSVQLLHQSPLPARASLVLLDGFNQGRPWSGHGGGRQFGTRQSIEDALDRLSGSVDPARKPKRNPRAYLDMNSCHTIGEATEMTYERLDILPPNVLAAFWTRLSQLVIYRDNKYQSVGTDEQQQQLEMQLNSIFAKTMDAISSTQQPQVLAQMALGFAKIMKGVANHRRKHPPGTPQHILHELLIGSDSDQKVLIFRSIANASSPLLPKFPARMLANLAYACAITGSAPKLDEGGTLFNQIADSTIPLAAEFKPQELANLVWSFDKVRASNPRLFNAVAEHIAALNHLEAFKPQDFANILLAFAKAGEPNPKLFDTVADRIVEHRNLREFKPQDLANTVWAFAKIGESNPKLFAKVANRIVSLNNLHKFTAQGLSNTVWAYAKAGQRDSNLFKKVADHIVALKSLHSFSAQALSNTVWAFAKAEESDSCLFQKVANHILALDNLQSFNSKGCSQILWSFATADIINVPLFEKVAAHANMNIDFKNLDKESQIVLLRAYEKAAEASKK